MKKKINLWKILAIIFFIIILLGAYFVYSVYVEVQKNMKGKEIVLDCYESFCDGYEEAFIENWTCKCYNGTTPIKSKPVNYNWGKD